MWLFLKKNNILHAIKIVACKFICVVKTDDNYIFRKFTLLVVINNYECVCSKLYQQEGMTKERFVEFLHENIFTKYKDNFIILDKAGSHNNQFVKYAIINSGNK